MKNIRISFRIALLLSFFINIPALKAQQIGGLENVRNVESRSISPENRDGEIGAGGKATTGTGATAARYLGQGWKISPAVVIPAHKTFTIAEISGPGTIRHIWMTPSGNWRYEILRFYWDDSTIPAIEVPVGDFFCMGWGKYAPVNSLAVCVNPGSGFNSYWPMPFRHKCRITIENIADQEMTLFYQVDYELGAVDPSAAYLHAQFRRVNPVPFKQVYTLVDSIAGEGQYVGTYMAYGSLGNGWWGEGEIKFYVDGDDGFPTICGTGTEDYFCGSYGFETREEGGKPHYTPYTTAYAGMPQVIMGDGHYDISERFGLYRWHITDPIHFKKKLKVTIQDLGWHTNGIFKPLQDDIATTVFWYQKGGQSPLHPLPARTELEVN